MINAEPASFDVPPGPIRLPDASVSRCSRPPDERRRKGKPKRHPTNVAVNSLLRFGSFQPRRSVRAPAAATLLMNLSEASADGS